MGLPLRTHFTPKSSARVFIHDGTVRKYLQNQINRTFIHEGTGRKSIYLKNLVFIHEGTVRKYLQN